MIVTCYSPFSLVIGPNYIEFRVNFKLNLILKWNLGTLPCCRIRSEISHVHLTSFRSEAFLDVLGIM